MVIVTEVQNKQTLLEIKNNENFLLKCPTSLDPTTKKRVGVRRTNVPKILLNSSLRIKTRKYTFHKKERPKKVLKKKRIKTKRLQLILYGSTLKRKVHRTNHMRLERTRDQTTDCDQTFLKSQ